MHGIDDLEIAPFHLLASEGAVHTGRDHLWHMDTLARLCAADGELLSATPYCVVDLADAESERAALSWWLDPPCEKQSDACGGLQKPLS